MKKTATDKIQRRAFLKGSAVTGAALGAGAVTTEALAEAVNDQPEKVKNKGYRETDHIRKYYRLARF